MRRLSVFWRLVGLLHRAFDVCVHLCFRIANFGRRECLPPISDLLLLSPATALAHRIRKGKLKSVDLVGAYIQRVKDVNPFLNAAVNERFDEALREARLVDELLASGTKTEEELMRETPFLGVPFSVKELIAVEGMPLSAGLLSRKEVRSPVSAQTVQLLRGAGAIPLCTTNVSELGMWYECYNRVYGRTNNPYDTSRTCGGSSGGEGALVGGGASVVGIGSDIGGSIRIPAFFNGVFGHKPSPEVVSNYGTYPPSGEREFVPYLSMGPLCRYATDLLPTLRVLAGKSAPLLRLDQPVNLREVKVWWVEDVGNHVMFTKVEADIISAIHKVTQHFRNAYKVVPQKLELPSLRHMYLMWASAISSCRAPTFSDELAERKGARISFRVELLLWALGQSRFTFPAIVLGLLEGSVLGEGERHTRMLDDLRRELVGLLGRDGVLLFPPHPTSAPHHNEPLLRPFNFAYTAIFNVLGFPVTQCPMGLGREGLPVGVQVAAAPLNDRLTLAVALELEKAFGGWQPPCKVVE